jgi:hypothetical protein
MRKESPLKPLRPLEDMSKLETLAALLREVPGVLNAHAWVRVPVKSRVYVELKKRNRQRCWDLEAGRRLTIHNDASMEYTSPWAGAMTRNWHEENKTWERIRDATYCHLLASP